MPVLAARRLGGDGGLCASAVEPVMRLLQNVELDARPEVSLLSYDGSLEGPPLVMDGQIQLGATGRVSFDSYFGSFWENYWFEFTHLETVTALIRVRGSGIARVMRRTPQGDTYLVAQEVFAATDAVDVKLEVHHRDAFRAQAGRLWIEVIADDPTTISHAGWYTEQEPYRYVALNVVFCTFNRLDYLSRIIQTIDSRHDVTNALARVTIVNQGEEFTLDDLLPSSSAGSDLSSKLEIVRQENLGGCGGFTRGLMETLSDPHLTHVLLLDDDIQIHADSLLRAVAFLSFAKSHVALGGHMLNLHRPNFVYEAGAQLDPAVLKSEPCNLETPVACDIETSEDDPLLPTDEVELITEPKLDRFLPTEAVAYNGWWFFALSREQIETAGLPLPCFIRGDDIEYGVRLNAAGIRTVAVPGIAVWHEPFYMKLGGWQYYFEIRNRLMMASIHGIGDWGSIKRNLFATFVRDVSMARYHSVMFMVKALNDYMAGPDVAVSTDNTALMECVAILKEYGPTRIDEMVPISLPKESILHKVEVRLPGSGYLARVHTAMRSIVRLGYVRNDGIVPTIPAAELLPEVVSAFDCYQVQEEFGNGVWRYERDPELERELWRQVLRLIPRIGPMENYRDQFEATDRWRTWWERKMKMSSSPQRVVSSR